MRSHPSLPHARGLVRLVLILATGLALVAGPLAVAPAQAAEGALSGTVTGGSGELLEGVYVTAFDLGGDYVGDVVTDAQGRYDLGPLPNGSYKLGFTDLGNRYATQYWQDRITKDEADPIDLTAAGLSGLDVRLSLNSTIEGTVTARSDGSPLEGVQVSSTISNGEGGWYHVSGATTSADGTYSMFVPKGRSYRVSFEHPDYATQVHHDRTGDDEPDPVVVDGPIVQGVDAALDPRPALNGQVTSPGGSAIGSVQVDAYQLRSGTWEHVTRGTTGPDGRYVVVVDTGTYRLGFSKPGYDSIAPEEGGSITVGRTAVSVPTSVLHLTPSVSISGTPKVGQRLTAVRNSFRTDETQTLQWVRSGQPIASATGSTYDLVAADQGKRIRVVVTGTRAGTSRAIESPDTAVVDPGTLTTSDPSLTGVAEVGRTLTVDPGVWGPDLEPSLQWYRGSTAIAGAYARTYVVTSSDIGQQLWVRATGTKAGYTTASRDSNRTAVVPVPPEQIVSTAPPTISGTAKVGQTLTATPGTWSASGVASTYQWRRAGQDISGATQTTYVLTSADLGSTLTVRVTGRRSGMLDGTADSAETAAVVQPTITIASRPTVSGTAQVGRTLTATVGAVSPSDAMRTYQWLRDGTVIPGATSLTYVPTDDDVDAVLTFRHSATRTDWTPATSVSLPTAAVSAAPTVSDPDPIVSVTRPTVAGTPRVGEVLTASPGTWNPTDVAPRYEWLRDGATIAGATSSTYRLVDADVTHQVAVRVTVSRTGWVDATATSVATTAVAVAAPVPLVNTAKPRITGTTRVGSTLTANPGTWNPSSVALAYQWRRNGVAVRGATQRTYVLTAADQGRQISLQVTASRQGYAPATVESARTAAIAAPPKAVAYLTVATKVSGRKPTFTVSVWARNATPTGKVYVKLGSRWLASGTLKSRRAVLTLPAQKKGTYRFTVLYGGDSKVDRGSVVKTVVVK